VIRVVVDDLAVLACDAIVRPATARLDPTTPAGRRLEQVGGVEFASHLRLQQELAVGAAVVTAGGGGLPAEFVIHAVIQSDTEPVTRGGVARAWQSALQQAREWEFASLSAPPIGTGAGNLSVEDAAAIMVPILQAHLDGASFPATVSFVVETPEDRDAFEAALRRAGAGGAGGASGGEAADS
jgi:O-acetyl-ADP-ribose deacetylase (regulator of RNase III)